MIATRKGSLALAVVLTLAANVSGAADESRRADLVTVQDGKFISDEYSLCEVTRPASFGPAPKFQMRTYSEAPAEGVISRDNFVAYTSSILTALSIGMVSRAGLPPLQALEALHCNSIASPIGRVDLEVRITMTADGLQTEVTDTTTGKVSRSTSPWNK